MKRDMTTEQVIEHARQLIDQKAIGHHEWDDSGHWFICLDITEERNELTWSYWCCDSPDCTAGDGGKFDTVDEIREEFRESREWYYWFTGGSSPS